jgi:hypothetical protein
LVCACVFFTKYFPDSRTEVRSPIFSFKLATFFLTWWSGYRSMTFDSHKCPHFLLGCFMFGITCGCSHLYWGHWEQVCLPMQLRPWALCLETSHLIYCSVVSPASMLYCLSYKSPSFSDGYLDSWPTLFHINLKQHVNFFKKLF